MIDPEKSIHMPRSESPIEPLPRLDQIPVPQHHDSAQLPPPSPRPITSRRHGDESGGRSRSWALPLLGMLLGVVGWGAWKFSTYVAGDRVHRHWTHLASAESATKRSGTNILLKLLPNGKEQQTTAIELGRADVDLENTAALQAALAANEPTTAREALQSAQPDVTLDDGAMTQESANWNAARDSRSQVFRVHLADACAIDGDEVDVLINGAVWTRVALQGRETTVAFPLTPGVTYLTLRGVRDGDDGGITWMLRSDECQYFAGPLKEGEEAAFMVLAR